jgi:hypothetical protein
MSVLSQPYFWDEQAAHAKLEAMVWPNGPVCIRCGAIDRIGTVTGKGARPGLKFCCRCRKQFRATIGTIFEGSHVPLHKWFQACFILSGAKTVVTAHQLHLHLEVTNKTAVGMIGRLQQRIISARQNSPRVGLDRTSRSRADSCANAPQWRGRNTEELASALAVRPRGGLVRVSMGIGCDELHQMQSSARPRRQFLRFVETAEVLGGIDVEEFDRLLTELNVQLIRSPHLPRVAKAIGLNIADPALDARRARMFSRHAADHFGEPTTARKSYLRGAV